MTRFKIEWDDKPNGVGDGSGSIDNENSGTGIESDVDDQTEVNCAPDPAQLSNSTISSTNLMMNLNLSQGSNGMSSFGNETERISADSTSSLLEPPGPLLTSNMAPVAAPDSDSMNTPMEVI